MEDNCLLLDALLDIPYYIEAGDKRIPIYPPSLGTILLVDKIRAGMDINSEMMAELPAIEILKLAEKYPDEMASIVAVYTFRNRGDAMDPDKLDPVVEDLRFKLDTENLAVAYSRTLAFTRPEEYIEETKIKAEIERRRNIQSIKSPSTSVDTGAVTIYGAVIDPACERYGWTYDYVLWGISYHNLRLLLADISSSIYLSDEEYNKARSFISREEKEKRGTISADDINNLDKIKEFFADMD